MTPFLTVDYSGGMLLEDKLILSGRVDDADNNRWNYSVRPVVDRSQPHRLDRLLTRSAKRVFFSNRCGRNWFLPLSRAGFRGPGGPGPQAFHQQGASHQIPQFLKPCNSIANPFLKSQIRHWAQASHQGPQASHQLNPALPLSVNLNFDASFICICIYKTNSKQ